MKTNRATEDRWKEIRCKYGFHSDDDLEAVSNENELIDDQLKKRNSMDSSNDDQKDYQNKKSKGHEFFVIRASSGVIDLEIPSDCESRTPITYTTMTIESGDKFGSGFVRFSEENDQKKALDLNESDFNDRTLKGQRPKNKTTSDGGGGVRVSIPEDKNEPNTSIYVGNLFYDLSVKDLMDFFKDCGKIKGARIKRNAEGKSEGYGFVDFYKLEDAEKALSKHYELLKGRDIVVHFAKKRKRKDRNEDQKDNNTGRNS